MREVFKLAKKMNIEASRIKNDYINSAISLEFRDGVLISMQVTLEEMEEIWDVNLSNYYIEW